MSGAGPQGGPTVGPRTVHVVEMVPVDEVLTIFEKDGGEQPTEIVVLIGAGRATVGWPGSLLHSRRLPSDPCVKPLPVTVNTVPSDTPVLGLNVRLPTAADAGNAATTRLTPPATSMTAIAWSNFTKRARPKRLSRRRAIVHPSPT